MLFSSVFGLSIPQWGRAVEKCAMLGGIFAWPSYTFHREGLFGGYDRFPVIPFCPCSRDTEGGHNQKTGRYTRAIGSGTAEICVCFYGWQS